MTNIKPTAQYRCYAENTLYRTINEANMEWLFNPWVISFIIVAVIASNIAALKYTAYMKFEVQKKHKLFDDKHPLSKQKDTEPQDKDDKA